MARGEFTWHTRSMLPISMPSSSEAVATSSRISPFLSLRSASRRSFLERLPWCAATFSAPSRSPRQKASRSAMARVLTKTRVDRCCRANSAMRS